MESEKPVKVFKGTTLLYCSKATAEGRVQENFLFTNPGYLAERKASTFS